METINNYKGTIWKETIDVSDFIKNNYKEYTGDSSFLASPTEKTNNIMKKCNELFVEENKKGVLAVDIDRISGINNFKPGYISEDDNVIVGLQTDAPLKRILNPFGGLRMVDSSLSAYSLKPNDQFMKFFKGIRKTHNDGVFSAYTKDIKLARKCGLITGLPDAYGRGRIIGDYRRIALYGVDRLIQQKQIDLDNITDITTENIRHREEVFEQITALNEIKAMASRYGFDISNPANNTMEAVQWTYFGFLAAIKENNGAAMSLGRVSTFFDIYIEKDLKNGTLTEEQVQEIIDNFVIKLRLVRHLRTPDYDEIFGGDPTWVTESIGGMLDDKKSLVTKTSFRILHTLINLKSAPEPNLTVLWSNNLPTNFKKYCAMISIETDAIQYENDDIMRPIYGNDYAIACCVSAMKIGKQMQFFGARCNMAKALLYAINGGVDEITGLKVIEGINSINDEYLNFETVYKNMEIVMQKLAKTYVDAMNIIHYMHDKYAYEKGQMALHDSDVEKLMAFGIAGYSVATDSLSAIKFAKVKPIRENGIAKDFEVVGDFPKYGNNDDDVDLLGTKMVEYFYNQLTIHPLYKNAKHTLSLLTITSNVMYGKKTGSTPDTRKYGEPFAPGANPMHGRDCTGALASLNSVAKIDYAKYCQDGVSNTFTILPASLGSTDEDRINNLTDILDGYFAKKAHHININVLNRETLIDAMNNPEKYPNLTIRVSGYAVNFHKLSKNHQLEVIARTFHEKI